MLARSTQLALLGLAALVVGSALRLTSSAPDSPLDCPPGELRWVDAGTATIAICAGGLPEGPIPAGQAMTVGLALDLNTATAGELALLPGIGPSTAAALVRHREERGGFETWDQVLEVRGIGPAKLALLQAHFGLAAEGE